MKKITFVEDSEIYKPTDIKHVLEIALNDKNLRGNNKGIYTYDVPCAFDIETTSFYRMGETQYSYEDVQQVLKINPKAKFEKCAIMYVWQLGINGRVIVGRTWGEFVNVCHTIAEVLQLGEKRKLIIYVHNLAYEFQFMRCFFEWSNVFSIDERKPIYATTTLFIEFRCSYLLTGYSLAKLGEMLQRYKVKKMIGDLDYNKVRHSQTPLTDAELQYCINDVRVVMATIQEKIENEKGITNIPLTKTGYVRKHCRKNALYIFDPVTGKRHPNHAYFDLMQDLQVQDLKEFEALNRAFQGGFTHANSAHVGNVIDNVASYDFTSSYPYVMVAEQYPMSRGLKVTPKTQAEFEHYINNYCCVFDIEFNNIVACIAQDNPISASKCWKRDNVVENNGRVYSATRICTTITNVDYRVYKSFYTWDNCRIGAMYVYKRGYLPTEFVKTILQLYADKTTLKGVQGKEVEYMASKEMVNACYGMTVTNPLRDEIEYSDKDGGKWSVNEPDSNARAELLYKYNIAKNRFLFYPWGVFVTAYARRNLFTGIYIIGEDYIYSDTDSIKLANYERHADYFNAYNKEVAAKLQRACAWHRIPFEMVEPRTIKGVTKRLGVWDFEGVYLRFKTLGAKRYMVQTANNGNADDFSLTVSGLNKRTAIPYLYDRYGNRIFDRFTDTLYIPPHATGKNLHTYIDYPIQGRITDYNGVTIPFEERTGVHLEPTDYTLNLSVLYMDYLLGKHLKRD